MTAVWLNFVEISGNGINLDAIFNEGIELGQMIEDLIA